MSVAAHPDGFAAKRMRKLTQRRAVDYTSTVVRYMQVKLNCLHYILVFLSLNLPAVIISASHHPRILTFYVIWPSVSLHFAEILQYASFFCLRKGFKMTMIYIFVAN